MEVMGELESFVRYGLGQNLGGVGQRELRRR